MIRLPEGVLREILSHARMESPREVCGWLAGRGGEVVRALPVPNAAEDPQTRFTMEPQAQMSAMREIREWKLEITGTYHSHPRTAAVPSARDRELAAYPDAAHLILSLATLDPEVRCYRITAEGISPLELTVQQTPHIVRLCDLCDTKCSSLLQEACFVTNRCSNLPDCCYKEA